MREALVIAKKEIRGFFTTPTFYVAAFLCLGILSWIYIIQLGQFVEAVQRQMFQQMRGPSPGLNIHVIFKSHIMTVNFLMLFMVPALMMRLFSEEKKSRTFDLLLTSPITSWHIVIGKYFAGAVAVIGMIGFTALYPLFTSFLSEVSWSLLFSAYLGMTLASLLYAAINLVCSALTESGIVAYVMSVILNLLTWFVGAGAELADGTVARQIFEHISMQTHIGGFLDGTIRTSSIIFFMSAIGLFCFFTERVVEASRWR